MKIIEKWKLNRDIYIQKSIIDQVKNIIWFEMGLSLPVDPNHKIFKIFEHIERLRPYVELGEIVADEYDQEWKDDYINSRIKQIKEQRDENN